MLHKFNPLFSGIKDKLVLYTVSGPATGTFDPAVTTSLSTTIVWKLDDGTEYQTTGTSHGISNTFANLGTHRCVVRVQGGLGRVTGIDCSTDAVTWIVNLLKLSNAITLDLSENTSLNIFTAQIPKKSVTLSLSNCQNVGGSLTDLPVTIGSLNAWHCYLIGGNSIAHFQNINYCYLQSMAMIQSRVDSILLSCSDAIHANVNYFTYVIGISLTIGGSDEAPSHMDGYVDPLVTPGTGLSDEHWLWDAGTSKHKALDGGAALWRLSHNNGHTWTITFNGGVAVQKLLGTSSTSWSELLGTDNRYYQQFTAVAGVIGEIRINSAISANAKVAIYTNAAGTPDLPGSVIAYSASVPIVAGWNNISLNITAILAVGQKYWLAVQTDASGAVQRVASGGTVRYLTTVYADAFATPVGTSSLDKDIAIAGWGY